MKAKPILIKSDGHEVILHNQKAAERNFSENWLQDLLDRFPQVLPTGEIEEVFWPLASIGREIATGNGGYIDNLLISKNGYPVIVETKLWRNLQAKREVVAQLIDYAADFANWSFERLDQVCKQKQGGEGLIDFIESSFDLDEEDLPKKSQIARNLKQGRFLLLIVGDEIRDSVIDMVSYINRFSHLSINVGLVELQTFSNNESEGEFLVVPRVVAQTEIVERTVVQIEIDEDINFSISSKQSKIMNEPETRKKKILSDDAFWEVFKRNSPGGAIKAEKLYEHFNNLNEVFMKNRQTAIVARLTLPESNQKVSLFYINKDGTISCQFSRIQEKLVSLGYRNNIADTYYSGLASLFNEHSSQKNIKQNVDSFDVDRFILLVEEFINKVLITDLEETE